MGKYLDAVQQAGSPKAAIEVIAQGIDEILERGFSPSPASEWGSDWSIGTEPVVLEEAGVRVDGDADNTTVSIPAPSPEKKEKRKLFEATRLHLSEHLGTDTNWTEIYGEGGPMWLYLGNRDLFMTFPPETRQLMVRDVLEDSPKDAAEMGRDVLKWDGETGPGSPAMMVGEGNIG